MVDADTLIDEGLEYLKAFPAAKEKRLTDFLWQTVENRDWGFNLIAHLTGRETQANAAWWFVWIGTDVLVLWIAAWVVLAPPVLLRNLLVRPAYEKRVRGAVRRCLR